MRRLNGVFLIVVVLVVVLLEYYSIIAFRFAIRNVRPPYKQTLFGIYIALTVCWFVVLLSFPMLRTMDMSKTLRNFLITFSMGFLITKLLIGSILLIDDIRRIVFYVISLFYTSGEQPNSIVNGMTRSEFLTKFALLFGGTVFGALLYGMTNRYNYKVKKISLDFDHLPNSFKGFKIIQISDIHSGSLSDLEAVSKGIDLIMDQKPDVIFFTGDLVNNKSEEAVEFIPIFSKLSAPHGVYSILGNHDYGDYVEWDSKEAKIDNLNQLKKIHADMGWKLLLDEHVQLNQGTEQIAVLGVENTSFKNRFHSYGNLKKAYEGSESIPFKILLSHDPSHWDGEVNSLYKDIALTLSGHTHGMQFGVEIPWLKWSPIKYIYKQWAGLYSSDNQHLYVNRGFGFLGYPGRVGIMPEITLIELV